MRQFHGGRKFITFDKNALTLVCSIGIFTWTAQHRHIFSSDPLFNLFQQSFGHRVIVYHFEKTKEPILVL